MGVFEVCLELPSDLKDQFGFAAGEFSELEHTRKSLACLIPVSPEPSRNHGENCHGCYQTETLFR